MSESSVQTQTGIGAPPVGLGHEYQLSDDLARLCLPQEYKDSYRTLAWVNSICFLFLLIGLVGLKPPKVVVRQISQAQEVIPVVFTPPEEPQKPEEAKPEEPQDQPTETPTDVPQVAQVVAAADPSAVAFAVPVPGAVAVAPMAHLATPPPPVTKAPPAAPQTFNPNAGGEGSFPEPAYPSLAARNHYQGTVIIEIMVEESGTISSVKVYKSSGFSVLDDAALQVVQRRWRFPPGTKRWLHWPCQFKLQ